jgi:regulator of sigma E protease
MPFVETADASMLVFRTLRALIVDKSVGISDLSGPIGIFQATATIVDVRDAEGNFDLGGSIISVLSWIGMLTVNIGLMNIIPLPALDGGRLAFITYEAITRKKPNSKVENTIHSIGFFLLMALFVVVAFNDILRIFGI